MAVLCRCKEHKPKNNRKNKYTHTIEPIGYPETSSICGRNKCTISGLIYKNRHDYH